MTKKIILIIMLTLSTQFAQAQKTYTTKKGLELPANELGISYGGMNLPEFAMVIGGVLGEAFSLGHAEIEKLSSTGCVAAEYLRYVSPYIALGATATAEGFQLKFKDSSDDGRTTFLSLMPTLKASWFRKEHFGMYSKLAAGAGASLNDKDSAMLFAFQVSPIGLEAGNAAVRGFAELGMGYQNFLCAGVRYCF